MKDFSIPADAIDWLEETCSRLETNDPSLKEVSSCFSYNHSGYGISQLTTACRFSHHVERLEIMNCREDIEAAQNLADLIVSHPSLKSLSLINCKSRGQFSKTLFAALQNRQTDCGIDTLEISGDEMNEDAYKELETMLATNETLTTLRINSCYFDEHAQLALIRGIQENKTLKHIRFSRCGLNDFSAIQLAGILSIHPSLVGIDLFRNKITDVGAIALAQAIVGSKVERLCLALNNLSVNALEFFARNIHRFPFLKELDLYDSEHLLSKSFYEMMVRNLDRNYTLTLASFGSESAESSPVVDELRILWEDRDYSVILQRFRMLLRLNKLGRGTLLTGYSDAPNAIQLLSEIGKHEGIDGLQYMLSSRPDLIVASSN